VIGYNGSLDIFDISNPEEPDSVGTWDQTAWWSVCDVAVENGCAYIAAAVHGFAVLDVSDPSEPQFLTLLSSHSSVRVEVDDTLVYLARNEAGWSIVNVKDPENPVALADFTQYFFSNHIVLRPDTAYVSAGGELNVFGVSDPMNPQLIGSYADDDGISYFFLSDSHVFVAHGYIGLGIADLGDLGHPSEIGRYDTPGPPQDLYVQDDIAYVAGGDAIWTVDISVPHEPEELGYYETPGYAYDVVVKDTLAYVADCYSGMLILDVSDPVSPEFVGNCSLADCSFKLAVADSFAYVCCNEYTGRLEVVDVSNPAAPTPLGSFQASFPMFDVAVEDRIAYVPIGVDGFLVIDVSDPMNPDSICLFDRPGYPYFEGVYLSDDVAHVAAGDSGLILLDVSNPHEVEALGSYAVNMYWSDAVRTRAATAFVATRVGVQSIDIGDVANPFPTGHFRTNGSARELWVIDRILYVADYHSLIVLRDDTYWLCGDCDASGEVDIDDAVFLIAYIFSSGPPPVPLASADADCSGGVDIDDVVYLIAYIFSGGYAPCDIDGDGTPDC
jgi:hypothetical protein